LPQKALFSVLYDVHSSAVESTSITTFTLCALTLKKIWHILIIFIDTAYIRESNGKLPLRTCPECSVPEPYWSPDWALVPAKTGPRAEY
jgi:hypothetical protein